MTGVSESGQALGSVLVTGATGRVGRALVDTLLRQGVPVVVISRRPERVAGLWPGEAVEGRRADITDRRSLRGVCEGTDTLFHLASYTPRPDEPDIYEAPSHWPVTAEGTANLMAEVAASAIRRVLYLSSIKAMGDAAGALGRPADEDTPPAPDSLYGRAKLAAETSVLSVAKASGIRASVIRLPMVYGVGAEGNIPRMIAAVAANRFPPWPRIGNRRSAIHLDDAIAASILASLHPASAGETFIATDGEAYSTRWLYEQILQALGRPLPSWSVPAGVLHAAALAGTLAERVSGRRMPLTLSGLSKLTGDAWFSSDKIRRLIGFRPRYSLESEIPRMVAVLDQEQATRRRG